MSYLDDDWCRQETVFHDGIKAAFRNGDAIPVIGQVHTHLLPCPLCNRMLEIYERGHRMTFAGPEPPCIQYHCDPCGFGGEAELP
jgi:hypothetical protein